jgi:hypothetical protein
LRLRHFEEGIEPQAGAYERHDHVADRPHERGERRRVGLIERADRLFPLAEQKPAAA